MPLGVCRGREVLVYQTERSRVAWSAVASMLLAALVGGEAGRQLTDRASPTPGPHRFRLEHRHLRKDKQLARSPQPHAPGTGGARGWGWGSPSVHQSLPGAQGDATCLGSFSHASGGHLCKQNCSPLTGPTHKRFGLCSPPRGHRLTGLPGTVGSVSCALERGIRPKTESSPSASSSNVTAVSKMLKLHGHKRDKVTCIK